MYIAYGKQLLSVYYLLLIMYCLPFTILFLYTHRGIPYNYVIPLWVYRCQQQNMYKYSYTHPNIDKYWI